MTFTLALSAQASGYGLASFDTIGSTSTDAMERARAGGGGPLWVAARRQTLGRGRRGAKWQTPGGNLAASLLLTTDLPPTRIATLGFVAGVALDGALEACCGNNPSRVILDEASSGTDLFRLKWPNDVLADGAKLAGILLETEEVAPGRRAVVIGIGVNVAAAPAGLPYAATSLAALGYDVDAEALFTALTASWVEAFETWSGEGGFPAIRERWLPRASGLGGAVSVRTGQGVTRGVFETIDDHGQLVIRVPDGSARTVSAGEVHFGVAASAPAEMRA